MCLKAMIYKLKTCQITLCFINIINIAKVCLNLILGPVKGRQLRKGRTKKRRERQTLERTGLRTVGLPGA